MGEDCGEVSVIPNLSEKGGLIYLTMKTICICNRLSEGRNREEGREGEKGNCEEANEAAVLGRACFT